jgi:hypothetical protein
MVESSGIALLSRREPDIVDLYLDIKRHDEFRSRTRSSKILPASDPLTADLNSDFAVASRPLHSNFLAIAARVRTSVSATGDGKSEFTSEMRFHDSDLTDPSWLLRHTGWLARVSIRCLRVIGASFDLQRTDWYTRVDGLEEELRRVLEPLRKVVFPSELEAEE